ncbi:hypothetical protein llap_452 [Limosa lapponica baueri]|uniref:Uncharacterized protein n=1 Tax=Limosa lapponica baueri TaxID=1758121 RepID=A0A2I0UT85_LIMLA|nr:hypothetical protein llap_452 [Limosa lapponica baueri]
MSVAGGFTASQVMGQKTMAVHSGGTLGPAVGSGVVSDGAAQSPSDSLLPDRTPTQTELPSSCGMQVPSLQLELSHASGKNILERMATCSPKTFSLDLRFSEVDVKIPCFGLGTEVG